MQILVFGEQALQVGTESRVACADCREPGLATITRQLEGLVEVRAERPPAIRTERRHEASFPQLEYRAAETKTTEVASRLKYGNCDCDEYMRGSGGLNNRLPPCRGGHFSA